MDCAEVGREVCSEISLAGEWDSGEVRVHCFFEDGVCGAGGGGIVGVYLDHEVVEVLDDVFHLLCNHC